MSPNKYTFDNSNISLTIEISENIPNDPNTTTNLFSVLLGAQAPIGELILPFGYILRLAEPLRSTFQSEFNFEGSDSLVERSLNPIDVNGNPDGFAVEQIYRDPDLVFDAFANASIDTNSPAAIVRVVFAEGGSNPAGTLDGEEFNGGLIEFETVSGEIYTRL